MPFSSTVRHLLLPGLGLKKNLVPELAYCGILACLPACGETTTGALTATDSSGGAQSSAGGALATGGTLPVAGTTGVAGAAPVGGAGGSGGGTNSAGGSGGGMNSAGGSGGGMNSAGTNSGGENSAGGGGASSGGSGGMPPGLPKKVLLYHQNSVPSIPNQLNLLSAKLTELGFETERSDDPGVFTNARLAEFGAVAMVNTCFQPFGNDNAGLEEAAVLKTFVENGGGLYGTHCATVTFKEVNPPHPYNVLFGGRGHGGFFEGQSDCRKVGSHPAIDGLPETFSYTGNLDDADYVAPDSTVLVKCKWSGKDMREADISWVREEGKGRVFFSNFAKTDDDLEPGVLSDQHLFPGLAWVLRQ